METENYYVHNLETDKLNIHSSKAFYDALPEEQRNFVKKYCLWSRGQQCWISKGKADNVLYLRSKLREFGFTDEGRTGERISFEQQQNLKQEKAEYRAERSEDRAAKAEQQSTELYERSREMAGVIPMGQPILVGHHSEQRDRNYRERIHNTMGKSVAAQDKADYYHDKADIARHTAEAKELSNPAFLTRRIKECRKDIRKLERSLKGQASSGSPGRPISEKSREFFTERLSVVNDKLNYYMTRLTDVAPEQAQTLKEADKPKARHKGKSI